MERLIQRWLVEEVLRPQQKGSRYTIERMGSRGIEIELVSGESIARKSRLRYEREMNKQRRRRRSW